MKTVRETVALPDATEHPLVHPLDLADSRKPFIASWWLSVLTMPTVVFFFAALLWTVSNNYVTPIVVPIATAICSTLLAAYLRKEAWAYIPRKRQDSQRRLPARWSLARSAISTASLLAGLVLLTIWLVGLDVDTGVHGYVIGSALGIVMLMVVGLLWTAFAPARLSASFGSWTEQAARLVAVAAAIVVGWLVFDALYDPADLAVSDILIGASVIVAAQVIWWLTTLWQSRTADKRTTSPPD